MDAAYVSADDIRDQFSKAMSAMYQQEVPQYGTLLSLVERVNRDVLANDADLARTLEASDEHVERALLVQLGVDAEALAEGVERAANLARIRVGEGVVLRVVQAVVVRDGKVLLAGVHPDERLHSLREQSVHILAAPRAERRRHPSPRRRVARG